MSRLRRFRARLRALARTVRPLEAGDYLSRGLDRHLRGRTETFAGMRRDNVCASYLHLHFASNPSAVGAWVEALKEHLIASS